MGWGVAWFAGLWLAMAAGTAQAADTMIMPGEVRPLAEDLVLAGSDSLLAGGDGPACQINGQTHSIRTMTGWTGTIRIKGCMVSNLGAPSPDTGASVPAISVSSGEGATFDVEGTTFDTSGRIVIAAGGGITFVFRGNTIAATSVVNVIKTSLDQSEPAFSFNGPGGDSQKLFQGNRILRSWVSIQNAHNWLIGGATPADSNVVVGTRAGFDLRGSQMILRGNYASPTGELKLWNQVATLYAGSDDATMTVEHNVLRGGNWLIRSFDGGELRYNLLGDPYAVAWVQVGTDSRAKIHHNVLVRNNKLMETFYQVDGIAVLGTATPPSVSIYNNTLDGSGYCYDPTGRGISVGGGAFLQSLRNNAFINLPANSGPTNTAIVGPGHDENSQAVMKGDPGPASLGYADYNLFNNLKAKTIDNYGISVAGATERVSASFALHDVPAGGTKDQQADPKLTGPLPMVFPFSDDDIIAGRVSVCQILAFYRGVYTPAAGSPMIDAGDPADGPGVDVGAVGAGQADPADLFGLLCNQADSLLAAPPTVVTKCPIAIGSTTGVTGPPPPNSFACVCTAAPGSAPPPGAAALAALGFAALLARRSTTARSGRRDRRGERSPRR